jgi:putative ABC transport system permease protein
MEFLSTLELILKSGLQQGLLFGFMVLGVWITFRVLDFPDLTVDGSLPLGAAVTAAMIVGGHSPWLATLVGVAAGLVAGLVTGSLHLLLKSGGSDSGNYGPKLLAGILVMTALWTVNLRVMGRPNVPLMRRETVFTQMGGWFSDSAEGLTGWWLILALFVIMMVVKYVLDWFVHTQLGQAMVATGDNEQMVRSLGVNVNAVRVLGLGIANALVAFSGSLLAQAQGSADISMGIGTIVAGLAGVIMGEVIFGKRTISWVIFSVIGGSLVFRLLIAIALRLGLAGTDLKLLTAVLVGVALSLPTVRRKALKQ